ncbi:right-handed parallel beta-helix repeat-containing protein, partial [Methanobrevibacter sp.]|uniref:beta strand repeat-containing protein n=1 Tax=Methanobrevibacter sp. TaxID=66852 RepID=UPI0026DEBDDB
MKYKKIMFMLVLAVFLLSITCVSASEIDDTLASEDTNTIGLSTDNDIEDNLQTSEENEALASTDYEEAIAQTDTEVLGADSATYFDLAEEIRHSGNITLTHKNYTYDWGGTILISEDNKVIDGNGAVIDMNGSTIRAFHVNASGVTIKNLTIKNANYNVNGGAIYFDSTGTVTNCNFTNNKATGDYSSGGAIFFVNTGTVTNCNFTNNKATGDYSSGGAISFSGTGTVTNCSFTGNTANFDGGAINMGSGSVSNCNFTDNTATYGGGAVWMSSGTVSNCNFTNNTARYSGGVYFSRTSEVTNCNFTANQATEECGTVYFNANGTLRNCNFVNNKADNIGVIRINVGSVEYCNFVNNSASKYGVIWIQGGNIEYCNFVNNSAAAYYGAVAIGNGNVTNCNFTGNHAKQGDSGAVSFWGNGNVTNCNFTDNNATNGGAVYFFKDSEGTVTNCNFTNNSASEDGGAVYFYDVGNVTNCNFIDNNATNGGAVYFFKDSEGTVTNCNFTNNSASEDGGAVYFYDVGNVTNCNFVNNTASEGGGAINMDSGTVSNCNFVDNKATGDYSYGGAIYIYSGTVTNCNFTGNTATYGGAVYFDSNGEVTNCNFVNNTASEGGGAINMDSGTVSNCNFVDNKATGDYSYGGAIYIYSGTVTNCNFIGNNATYYGGAIYFSSSGTTHEVRNCNFTNNTASRDGGAIDFEGAGTVTNCNFTGNNATTGSAIYFYSTSATKTVFNSRFLNNRANAEALEVTKNDNNITITFTGKDNLLNAIYSRNDAEVTFTDVTYWSANGITTTGSSAIKPSRSNKAAGQNITVGVVVNGELVLSGVYLTDENGMIVLDISAGENYFIGVRHDTDSYYTEAEKTISNNTKFGVNVTSQTTNNKTVNITAKSNIYSEVMPGKLLFIVQNTDPINATYAGNGTWWTVYAFDAYGDYQVNATYSGLDNVTVNNATISISKTPTEITLVNETVDLFVGDSINSGATLTPSVGNLTFTSNNESVAKVEEGNIIAVGEGSAVITVSFEGSEDYAPAKNKTITVGVSKIPTDISVNTVSLDLSVGDEAIIVATLTPADAGNVTFTSSDENIV